jgi:hypothetical protein
MAKPYKTGSSRSWSTTKVRIALTHELSVLCLLHFALKFLSDVVWRVSDEGIAFLQKQAQILQSKKSGIRVQLAAERRQSVAVALVAPLADVVKPAELGASVDALRLEIAGLQALLAQHDQRLVQLESELAASRAAVRLADANTVLTPLGVPVIAMQQIESGLAVARS